MKKSTTEEFIEKARKVHSDKYDYSKVNYVNSYTKVCIICPEHGEFWQTPHSHLNNQGCPYCKGKHKTTEMFVNEIKKRFPQYDYSKVKYIDCYTKVCIICPEHGEFWQSPSNILNGYGCQKCGKEKQQYNNKKELLKASNAFIEKANKIHNNKYGYSLVNYIGANKKVEIICKKCNTHFFQTPHSHLSSGRGCPICKSSKLENDIRKILKSHNILYEEQKMFNWLKMDINGYQSLDFFLPEYNIAIECQGIQHFQPVDFGGNGRESANKHYEYVKLLDNNKVSKCNENNIKILYYTNIILDEYPYEVITDLNELMKNIKDNQL